MLAQDYGLISFVQKVTKSAAARLLHHALYLGQYLLMDYMKKKLSIFIREKKSEHDWESEYWSQSKLEWNQEKL